MLGELLMPGRGRLPAGAETPTGSFRFLFPVLSLSPSFFPPFSISFLSLFLLLSPPKIPSIHFTMANFSSSDVTAVKFVFLFPNSVLFQSPLAPVLTSLFFVAPFEPLPLMLWPRHVVFLRKSIHRIQG